MTTLTLQPSDTTGIDAYIDEHNPTTNYNNTYLEAGGTTSNHRRSSYLKFDLSSITPPYYIDSAVLTMRVLTFYGTNQLFVYPIRESWTETGITWNNKPALDGSNIYYTAGITDVGTVNMSLNVDEFNNIIHGITTNYGICLYTASKTDGTGFQFASSQHATTSYRPKLVITYHAYSNGGCQTII